MGIGPASMRDYFSYVYNLLPITSTRYHGVVIPADGFESEILNFVKSLETALFVI